MRIEESESNGEWDWPLAVNTRTAPMGLFSDRRRLDSSGPWPLVDRTSFQCYPPRLRGQVRPRSKQLGDGRCVGCRGPDGRPRRRHPRFRWRGSIYTILEVEPAKPSSLIWRLRWHQVSKRNIALMENCGPEASGREIGIWKLAWEIFALDIHGTSSVESPSTRHWLFMENLTNKNHFLDAFIFSILQRSVVVLN